ncbi:hypothetical protein [Dyella sedimenti]|uniref:hypothetical protein n=1 Tax=Dyella sedimenti TaxID=2919947 RepID=UPI001FAA7671|nr:hypothetical protein [Dyella sedimenti]
MRKKRGNPRLDEARNTDTVAANSARAAKADDFAREVGKRLHDFIEDNGLGYNKEEFARHLNEIGFPTQRGGKWSGKQVARIFDRLRVLHAQKPRGRR